MEKLGKAAANVSRTASSPRNSAPVSRRGSTSYTVNNIPIARDHFIDSTIPDRVWSSFIPAADQGERTLKRAMTATELSIVQRRAAALDDCLQPFGPSERDRVALAISEMYASFTASRDEGAGTVARNQAMQEVLAVYPAWAIEVACLQVRQKGYTIKTVNGTKLEQTFPPSESIMFSIVGAVIEVRARTADNLRKLLAAPIEPQPEEVRPTAEQIEAGMVEFRKRLKPIAAAKSDAEEEQERRERTKAGFKRAVDDARQSYLAAGLDPPPTQNYGPEARMIPTLSFLLSNGWVIVEMPDGSRKLVAPRRPGPLIEGEVVR